MPYAARSNPAACWMDSRLGAAAPGVSKLAMQRSFHNGSVVKLLYLPLEQAQTANTIMSNHPYFRRDWLAAFVLAAACLCSQSVADEPSRTAGLTIDYGDGVQKTFTSLPWKEKMTVFDLLKAAEKSPRGIKVAHTGSGETFFITAIDDLSNEGAGGNNWRYTVNGNPALSSAGVM